MIVMTIQKIIFRISKQQSYSSFIIIKNHSYLMEREYKVEVEQVIAKTNGLSFIDDTTLLH